MYGYIGIGMTLFFSVAFIAVGVLMLMRFPAAVIGMIWAYREQERFEPVDTKILGYRRGAEDMNCHITVERADGICPRGVFSFFTLEEEADEEWVKAIVGKHLTMYAQPSAPNVLFTAEKLKRKNGILMGFLELALFAFIGIVLVCVFGGMLVKIIFCYF